jgi:CheY-like chemotaxis protein
MNANTPTLLYIDDDPALARLVERGMTRLGVNVVHAPGGEEGLERLQQGGIDVDRARSIHARPRRPRDAGTILESRTRPPVVFVTASQDSAIAVTALKAGAADYLVEGRPGRFHPPAPCRRDGAIRQAEVQRARDEARPRSTAGARPLCGARRRARVLLREVNHPRRQHACRSSPRCCTCRPIQAAQDGRQGRR